jgi:hypothetical protein
MTARERFSVNQRVQQSALGHEVLGPHTGASAFGIVRGFGRKAHQVRVQREAQRSTCTYHEKFWEPARAEGAD